jgi:hypothetical protein
MRTTTLLVLLLSLGLAGCECSSPSDPDAGRDAPAPTDVPGGTDTPTPADAPEDLDASEPSDAPADVPADLDAPADAPSTDAPGGLSVTISEFSIFGNCMPIVPPDPIVATWTITVAGATGAPARFVTGTLTFSSGETQTITVEDDTIALVGGAGSGEQRRAGGTPAVPGCGTVCSASVEADLVATYEVDGTMIQVEASGPYFCAF